MTIRLTCTENNSLQHMVACFLWHELFMTFVSERNAFLAQTDIEFNNFM